MKIMSNKLKIEDALKTGYIRIFRTLKDWEWYTDIPCKVLYLHCLLMANHTTKNWKGEKIERGTFVTSYSNLAADTGLSVQEVRTAIKKLEKTENLTCTSTNKKTVVKVLGYCVYQNENLKSNMHINIQSTYKQHTSNKQSTTTNNENNIEREYRTNFEILIKYAELKKAKNPVAYANKVMQSPCLDEVVKNIKIELDNSKKLEEKKKKIEQEKIEEERKIRQGCNVSSFSDSEILEELRKFNEAKTAFKSPIVKDCEKEAEKRGLKI